MPYDLRRRFKLEKIVAVPSVISTYSWNQYVWFKYVLRHWIVRWYINKIELGARYAEFKFILGWPESVFLWDGGHCMGVRSHSLCLVHDSRKLYLRNRSTQTHATHDKK
jgi:hypothetical protein